LFPLPSAIAFHSLLWRLLQLGPLFCQNCPFHWAHLDADATVNTGCKINPVPISPLDIFAGTFVDTSNGTGINAIGDAFAGICNYRVWHSVLFF
jgi:hypothetical protein